MAHIRDWLRTPTVLLRKLAPLTVTAWLFAFSPVAAQVSWLPSGSTLIQPSDVPPNLGVFLQVMGSRMTTADTAQVTFLGTTTDAKGSRAAQIIVQAPGYMSYREGNAKALTFDGSQYKSKAGSVSGADEPIQESLMAHIPDAIFLQIAAGGSVRRVGGHFRATAGSYWTMFAFSPRERHGLARGKALQQDLFVCIDESTGLISEVRSVVGTSPNQQSVIQTQFSGWSQQNNQWFPGQIVRLEGGSQTLSFKIQQASVGSANAVTSFEP